jgi:hypothetical protein
MICSTPPGFGPDLIGMFSGFVAYGRRGRGGASLQSKPPHLTFRAANGVPPRIAGWGPLFTTLRAQRTLPGNTF